MRAQSQLIWEPFLKSSFFNAFSSPDLVHWTKHPHVLDVEHVSWAAYGLWAPSAVEHKGKYYVFFGANDIKSDAQLGAPSSWADRSSCRSSGARMNKGMPAFNAVLSPEDMELIHQYVIKRAHDLDAELKAAAAK